MNDFNDVRSEILSIVNYWTPILNDLPEETVTQRKNSQNRSIKQITGHIIDSISNNTHRFIHLQYQQSPLIFPNYASFGNNDRWIAIQDYQNENWPDLVQLMKYSLLHIRHVIRNVKIEKTNNEWISGPGTRIAFKDLIVDFLRHLKLHFSEIQELIDKK
jgi:hypothetical protein